MKILGYILNILFDVCVLYHVGVKYNYVESTWFDITNHYLILMSICYFIISMIIFIVNIILASYCGLLKTKFIKETDINIDLKKELTKIKLDSQISKIWQIVLSIPIMIILGIVLGYYILFGIQLFIFLNFKILKNISNYIVINNGNNK